MPTSNNFGATTINLLVERIDYLSHRLAELEERVADLRRVVDEPHREIIREDSIPPPTNNRPDTMTAAEIAMQIFERGLISRGEAEAYRLRVLADRTACQRQAIEPLPQLLTIDDPLVVIPQEGKKEEEGEEVFW